MRIALYPNFQKVNALECARKACDILNDTGIEVCVSEKFRNDFSDKPFVNFEDIKHSVRTADFVIAIGGDGTILRCSKLLMGTDTKLLGINTGTLGFMAGLESDQLDRLELLKTGNYEVSERMTLDVIFNDNGTQVKYTALNEISARSGSFHICDFEVFSDSYLVGRHRADGVLFSTPSGSTAHALSAGGSVIEPDLECIEMTQICPHSLFSRPTIFASYRKLALTNRTRNDEYMVILVDGQQCIKLEKDQSVSIVRGSNNIRFVNLIGNSFHESLCRKLCKPIK